MLKKKIFVAVAVAGGTLGLLASPAVTATAHAAPARAFVVAPAAKSAPKYKFKNCTAVHKVYKHGVGKSNARDHTSGKRVTNFKHSTSLYKKMIGYHRDLDRDRDGIACEKH